MVDILLTTFNGENYIKEQMDSLLNQTYDNYRILVRDDGSTDKTCQIINDYRKRYPDKVIIIEDKLCAKSAAKNFWILIKHATADYVMFCDQDDYWFPNKIADSVKALEGLEKENGKDCPALIYTDYDVADANLNVLHMKSAGNQKYTFNGELEKLLVQNYVTGCLMAINKSLCDILGEYNNAMLMHDWWIALVASATGVVKHVPIVTMKYRQHGNNEVGAVDIKSFKYRLGKILANKSKENANLCFRQAEAILEEYDGHIPANKKYILEKYINVKSNKSKIKRIHTLCKGGYLKSDLVRVIGQILYI